MNSRILVYYVICKLPRIIYRKPWLFKNHFLLDRNHFYSSEEMIRLPKLLPKLPKLFFVTAFLLTPSKSTYSQESICISFRTCSIAILGRFQKSCYCNEHLFYCITSWNRFRLYCLWFVEFDSFIFKEPLDHRILVNPSAWIWL